MIRKLFTLAICCLTALSCSNKSNIRQQASKTAWELHQYIDGYGDSTNSSYVSVNGTGSFSNSATNNSKLEATLYVDKENINIRMFEYGVSKITCFDDDHRHATIYVKGKDNKEVHLGDWAAKFYDGDLELTNDARKKLMPILLAGGKVKFQIFFQGAQYNFTIPNTDGLKEMLDKTNIDHTEDLDSAAIM